MTCLNLRKIFLTGVVLSVALTAQAYQFTRFNTANSGLSYDGIGKIMQDSRGFLWVGTFKGLNRYDGNRFKVFYKEDLGLESDFIHTIVEDREGNLWIGTDKGVTRYEWNTDRFIPVDQPSDKGTVMHNKVTCITLDPNGDVWLLVNDQGFFHYCPETGKLVHYPYEDLGAFGFRRLLFLDDGTPLASRYHVNLFRAEKGLGGMRPVEPSGGNEDWFKDDEIEAIFQGGPGVVYVASNRHGISRLDWDDNTVSTVFPLPENTVLHDAFFEDGHRFWLSTTTGVWSYDLSDGVSRHLAEDGGDAFSLSGQNVWSTFVDRDGGLWVGTLDSGLNYCGHFQQNFERQYKGLDNVIVSGFAEDGRGNVWVGTERSGLLKYSTSERTTVPCRLSSLPSTLCSPCMDGRYLWIGSLQGLYKMDVESGRVVSYGVLKRSSGINDPKTYIVKNISGEIYAGTTLGLFRYDRERDTFRDIDYFSGLFITSLCEDALGRLWVSTYASGLFCWDPRLNQPPKHYSAEENGLSSDKISSVYVSSSGKVWIIGFSSGFTCLDPEDLQPVNPDPRKVENTEECFYIGMRNLQFHQAHVDPNDYFLEVLRRDKGDVRANTQMGIYWRQAGNPDKAKGYLRTAIRRQTAHYTRPSDGEAMYNLGLVLKEEGRYDDAVDTLYRAAWDYAYASPSYCRLAQISSLRGNDARALEEARMAVSYNGMNVDAKNLLVSLLRKGGQRSEALKNAREILSFDPLNFYAQSELVAMGDGSEGDLEALLRGESENYLELALHYIENGFEAEGQRILEKAEQMKPYPTVEYWLGYLADTEAEKEDALAWFRKAESAPTDYVFPFRLSTARALDKALEYIPESATTWYYLGNLWYQKQPDKALSCWTKAVEADPSHAMSLRNIGWYWRFKDEYHAKDPSDYDKAISFYRKAIEADGGTNPLFLAECDEIMEHVNAPLEERYALFAGREQVYEKRYDSETKAIRQRILHGEYEPCLDKLLERFYSRREHIEDLHDIYVDACLLSGFKAWKEGDDGKALKYMLLAGEYPANHGYAHLEYSPRDAQVWYNTGLAYEKCGQADAAKEWHGKAAGVQVKDKDAKYLYEKGLALEKLGRKDEARRLWKQIPGCGKALVTDYFNTFFESFDRGPFEQDINSDAYYTMAVGYQALGRNARARKYFKKALEERNDNVWANYYLGYLK